MGLILCGKHGQSGVVPFVSKKLSNEISLGNIVNIKDFSILHVIFYDDDEILGKDKYYLMKEELPQEAITSNPIKIYTDEDENKLNILLGSSFLGGGCCVICFESWIQLLNLK